MKLKVLDPFLPSQWILQNMLSLMSVLFFFCSLLFLCVETVYTWYESLNTAVCNVNVVKVSKDMKHVLNWNIVRLGVFSVAACWDMYLMLLLNIFLRPALFLANISKRSVWYSKHFDSHWSGLYLGECVIWLKAFGLETSQEPRPFAYTSKILPYLRWQHILPGSVCQHFIKSS